MKITKILLATLLIISSNVYPAARHTQLEEEKKSSELINTDELTQAISNGEKEKAIDLIKSGKINLNFIPDNKITAIAEAIIKDYADILKLLLEHGADANARISNSWTPLMYASIYRSTESVKLLLEHGVDVNTTIDHCTAFKYACNNGFFKIIKLLLDYGVNVNDRINCDQTALMVATNHNAKKIVKLLLEYGADINLRTNENHTALDFARENEFFYISYLLQTWPIMNKFTKDFFENNKNYDINDFKLYPTLLKENPSLENVFLILKNKKNGNTLLHEAVIKKDYKLIDYIFNFNPDAIPDLLSIPNDNNMTPIDLAVTDEHILNYFIKFGYPS